MQHTQQQLNHQQTPHTNPAITPRQQTILQLLYRFRFLDRTHIQTLMHHKAHPTIQNWLHDLTQKQYLHRDYTQTHKENSKPAIYSLATNGIRQLKTLDTIHPDEVTKLYREPQRSPAFVQQCLLLASVFIDLAEKTLPDCTYSCYTRHDYDSLPYGSLLRSFNPAGYIIRQRDDETDHYLIEFVADIPRYRIRKRIRDYFAWYFSNEWEGATGEPFPIILLICSTNELRTYVKRYIRKSLDERNQPNFKIRMTLLEKLQATGFTGQIWDPLN